MKHLLIVAILGLGMAHAFTHPSMLDSIGGLVDGMLVLFVLRRTK